LSIGQLSDQPSWVTFRGGALLASAWTEGSDQQALIVSDVDGTSRFGLTVGRAVPHLETWLLYRD
jgi:hypothetical protein